MVATCKRWCIWKLENGRNWLSDCDRFWSLYAMDRDNNWDRMVRAERRCLIAGKTCRLKPSARRWTACRGLLNKHLEPIVFLDKVVRLRKTEMDFFCFFCRPNEDADEVPLEKEALNLKITTMTEYDNSFAAVVFPSIPIETTLSMEVASWSHPTYCGKSPRHLLFKWHGRNHRGRYLW